MSVSNQHCLCACAGFLEDHTSLKGEGKAESQRTWGVWGYYLNCTFNIPGGWTYCLMIYIVLLCVSVQLFVLHIHLQSVPALVLIELVWLNSKNEFLMRLLESDLIYIIMNWITIYTCFTPGLCEPVSNTNPCYFMRIIHKNRKN